MLPGWSAAAIGDTFAECPRVVVVTIVVAARTSPQVIHSFPAAEAFRVSCRHPLCY